MKEIKTRIKSVESTRQITKAMELVSTQLGITVTNPSTGLEGNVKQP